VRRPRPKPKKVRPATERLAPETLAALAARANYVGSPHHKDVPTFGLTPGPRKGAMHVSVADQQGIDNPDCTICPRKWTGQLPRVTELLREAIQRGHISDDAETDRLPRHVWARDPDEPELVYEARLLSWPADSYKAYPLTRKQAEALPIHLP
jgi:hypothetical protein